MNITKISDTEIKVVKEETKIIEVGYTIGFLLKQKEIIEAQKALEMAQRDKEIEEVLVLIVECEKLGMAVNPVAEPIQEDKDGINTRRKTGSNKYTISSINTCQSGSSSIKDY